MIKKGLLYSKDHEWLKVEGNKVKVGITDHAQDQLGDIVFIELPSVGDSVSKGEGFAVIESVKAAADVYAPVSGTIVEINEELLDAPETVNNEPYDGGWLVVIQLDDEGELDDLLSPEEYQTFIEEE
ncbi:glycine cleavage system H protein [Anaerobranca californiensis DSM 14826]|uniref:Glycine cleavage system H protein n=1 Tax=Anaerobranca californiensis DSM 14826 TaxID=1120989 RepID=A0A1M6L926_9FIRM|nr:glycine cleavage system protein GcvH [Anaerobranca californiensis]SHJ67697.1 glycine cleavage system H protein [Anaerobranca californiensis DSM 14826]